MKKKFKTIEEQSDRIKSLFSEERLYGNLVTEQTEEECIRFLKQKGYTVADPDDIGTKAITGNIIKCVKNLTTGAPTPLGVIWKKIDSLNNIYKEIKADGECEISIQAKQECQNSHHFLYGSVWDLDVDKLGVQILLVISETYYPKNKITLGGFPVIPVKYVGYEGTINKTEVDPDTNEIPVNNFKFSGLYQKSGGKIPGSQNLGNQNASMWEKPAGTTLKWETVFKEITNIDGSNSTQDLLKLLNEFRCFPDNTNGFPKIP